MRNPNDQEHDSSRYTTGDDGRIQLDQTRERNPVAFETSAETRRSDHPSANRQGAYSSQGQGQSLNTGYYGSQSNYPHASDYGQSDRDGQRGGLEVTRSHHYGEPGRPSFSDGGREASRYNSSDYRGQSHGSSNQGSGQYRPDHLQRGIRLPEHEEGFFERAGHWAERKLESFFGKGPKAYKRTDDDTHADVSEAIARDHDVDASDIEVKVDGGLVTLTGTVPTRFMKGMAEECALRLSGVHDVSNMLRVQQPGMTESRSTEGARAAQNDPNLITAGQSAAPAPLPSPAPATQVRGVPRYSRSSV